MKDFSYFCENLARKIFQCDRSEDPLGRLADVDHWIFADDEFNQVHKCMVWALLSRLQSEYLDSIVGREDMLEKSEEIEEKILSATSNSELKNLILQIEKIVEKLNLSEFPRIDYRNTNDK